MRVPLAVASLVLAVACGGAAATVRAPALASPREPQADLDPPGPAPENGACAEPRALVLLGAAEGAAALTADPLAPPVLQRDEDTETLHLGDRVLSLEYGKDDLSIVAREGNRELWRAHHDMIAGGVLGLFATASGAVIGLGYSRGGVELFDAGTGASLGEGERDLVVSPDARFAIDVPAIGWGTERFDRADVRHLDLVSHGSRPIEKLPLAVDQDYDDFFAVPVFGAGVCPTGALYAISFPGAEVSIHRASDDAVLASAPNAPPGTPTFSASGHLVAVGKRDEPTAAVYRLSP
jgi:hypothetical protein